LKERERHRDTRERRGGRKGKRGEKRKERRRDRERRESNKREKQKGKRKRKEKREREEERREKERKRREVDVIGVSSLAWRVLVFLRRYRANSTRRESIYVYMRIHTTHWYGISRGLLLSNFAILGFPNLRMCILSH